MGLHFFPLAPVAPPTSFEIEHPDIQQGLEVGNIIS